MNNDEFLDEFDQELSDEISQTDDEFDSDDEDFEEAYEIELTNVKNRTAVLQKNEMIALLGVQTFDQGGAICRVDPRDNKPAVQLYDNAQEAVDWFKKSLRTSRKNGWNVIYDGLPLHG